MEKVTINAREGAPLFATQDMYVNGSRKSSIVGKSLKSSFLCEKYLPILTFYAIITLKGLLSDCCKWLLKRIE